MKKTIAPANLNPKGYQQLTPTTVQTLTVPVGAEVAHLQAEGQDIRYRDDDVDPTDSVGMLLVAGSNPVPYVGDLAALRFLEASGGAILNVNYYSVSS